MRVAVLMLLCSCSMLVAESIDRVVLPSGLTIVTAELHTSRAVEVRVVVRAGPTFEGDQVGSGLSALTQRLIAAGGAGEMTPAQVRDALSKLGNQGEIAISSGHSSFALTTTAEDLASALQLMAARVTAPTYSDEDLLRERTALTQIVESPSNEALRSLLYRQHPARLPVNGIPALRDTLSLSEITAYRQRRYRSANTVVLVCGNVNSLEARRLVEQAFASYPVGGFAPSTVINEPPPVAPRYQVVTSSRVRQPQVTVAWRTESIDHPSQPGLAVLAALLGGEQGLVVRLLRPKGLAEDISVEHVMPVSAPGYIRLSFKTTSEKRAEAEQTLYKGFEQLAAEPMDESRLAAARAAAITQRLVFGSSVRSLSDELMTWELATGDPAYSRRFTEQVQDVNGDEVMRVFRRYLLSRDGDRGRCTVVLRPLDATSTPTPTDVIKAPNPSSVVMPEVVDMPHGVRLLMRPTLEQPLVHVGVVLGGGASVEGELQQGATALLAHVLSRGSERSTSGEVEATLNRLGMRLSVSGNEHSLSIVLSCFPEDVVMAIDLITDWMARATLPVEEVDLMRQRLSIENTTVPWDQRFFSEVCRVVLADHYGAQDPRCLKNGLAHLDRTILQAHYRRLAVGANAVLVVYGRFDRMLVSEKVKMALDGCLKFETGELVKPQGTPWGERTPSLTVLSHDESQAALALVWRGPTLADRDRDEAAMQVLGSLLQSRLQRVSALFPPTTLGTFSKAFDHRGIWLVQGSCPPEQTDAVVQAVRDEIARFIAQLWLPEADRGALPDAELIAARTAASVRYALTQEALASVAVAHATTLLLGQDLKLDIERPKRLAAVSRKDLLRVAQNWLTGEPMTVLAKPKALTTTPSPTPGATTPNAALPAATTNEPTSGNTTPQTSPALPTPSAPVTAPAPNPATPLPVPATPPPVAPRDAPK